LAKNKKLLEKKNWISSFTIIGEAKVGDYTYQIDEKSEKSDWIWNKLNLGVFCGEKFGNIYAEMMGGYGAERDNVVYVHGKKEDGKDDFENKFTIDWDDRFDDTILETVGDLSFITVGLEKDKKDKVFYKKFLTPYDAIAYIKEHLDNGMVVNVKGNIKYSVYNDETQVKKEINSIVLSKVDDKEKYAARFIQTMLLTKDSIGKVDKEKSIFPIYGKILDYAKEYKGKEVKCNIPYNKGFEYEFDINEEEKTKKVISKVFKVTKGVTEITFEGEFIAGGALVTATIDDLPADIKDLIDMGVFTEEEALTKCTVNTGKELRMILRKPLIKMIEDNSGNKTPVVQKFDKKYDEEDLILDFMLKDDDDDDNDNEDALISMNDKEDKTSNTDDNSWLDNL